MNRTAAQFLRWPTLAAVLWFLSSFFVQPAVAQRAEDTLVTVQIKDKSFQEALSIIEFGIPYKFAYSSELAAGQPSVSISAVRMPLHEFLAVLFQGRTITYHIIGAQIILQQPQPAQPSRVTLSGYVKDARTGESLIGASVYLPSVGTGILSNNYGFYSISVPFADSVDLEISYVGYKTVTGRVGARADLTQSFLMEGNVEQIEIGKMTVTSDKREDNVRKNQTALVEMSTDMITAAPSAAGAGDVIGSVEMMPGVQAGIDGTPGYFVRGGNAGQNLILLDEATLYNPSHIFGLVGIFNPPAIKHASLLKGGFPASYGDHISSVLDVAMKDGNNQEFGGTGQMGSVSSGVTLYGPLQKGKSSFLVSARRSMTDVLLHPFLHKNYFSNYYFYDVNAKVNFQVSDKDRILLSYYSGRDNNTYTKDSTDVAGIDYSMHFGNSAAVARWNHQYSGKLFSNTSIEYNHYHQWLSATQLGYFAQLYSGIRDMQAKMDLTWYLSAGHKINAGADYLYQTVYPASLSGKGAPGDSSGTIVPSGIPPKMGTRVAVYASDDIKIGERWKVYAGIRAPLFLKPGVHYLAAEPRLSVLYMINPSTSIKVSFADVHQYIHLMQSYNASFPAEVWIGSSKLVRPQESQEVSAGLFKNFSENVFQTSLEVYYRRMKNQLLFGGDTTFTLNTSLEDQLIFGRAWSYGAELLVRKNRGRWTGWLAYTLAYANQQFDSLNEGQQFPFAYDRRHMLNLSMGYSISSHWKIGANFLIASGRAFSLSPDSSFVAGGGGSGGGNGGGNGNNPLYNPGRGLGRGRNNGNHGGTWDIIANNYRLSPYDRLDLNIRYTRSRTVGRRTVETEWIFSVYNVYARRNNSFVYRTIDPATRQVVARELPFIPIIPSITYSIKF